MESPGHILIADDQADVLQALRLLLKGEGFETRTAESPKEVVEAVRHGEFDAALIDLNYTRDTTSGREGLDLLRELTEVDPGLPVIVMTAWGSVDSAVEAMRRGARDYMEKPWDNARLLTTLRTQVELGRAVRRARQLEEQNRHLLRDELPRMVAESPAMKEVVALMERIAPSEANVLITGDHGTGKEVAARWLHAMSGRRDGQLVTLNAGAIPEGLVESELFGHIKGAFTDAREDRVGCFELADGGTLFLDEIATIPLSQQSKLLRVLETGEVQRIGSSRMKTADVRVISATNADLQATVEEGIFREDLLYRLNTVEVKLPPLRERREDIPLLAAHFLGVQAVRYRRVLEGFSEAAMEALKRHPWPGNVRELEHAVERAVLMAPGSVVQADDLGLEGSRSTTPIFEEMTLDEAEKALIERALEREEGNVSRAARALGLSRSALYRRLQRHGL